MSTEPVYVSLEFTPNPNTLKYSINRTVLSSGSLSFSREKLEEAQQSAELAFEILQNVGIDSVMLGRDFVTITKGEESDWEDVHSSTTSLIKAFFEAGRVPAVESEVVATDSGSEVEKKIQDIINAEIRPAVAMDGGDILFSHFSDGVVYVELSGSCAGCPSATATLKMGVENRLREMIPEVKEVVSV